MAIFTGKFNYYGSFQNDGLDCNGNVRMHKPSRGVEGYQGGKDIGAWCPVLKKAGKFDWCSRWDSKRTYCHYCHLTNYSSSRG